MVISYGRRKSIPGQYELGSAATFYGDFRNPPVLDERIAIQKRMKFPVREDRSVDLVYRVDAFTCSTGLHLERLWA